MLIAMDGSSKQRGHSQPTELFSEPAQVLFPSACAALYRREMLEEIGLFDGDFFLYCEDTDLGLRARWNGWECVYVPCAKVEHHYSQSAGAASPLKAWQIERNRLWVVAKNFPAAMLWGVPLHTLMRYAWHAASLLAGRGSAGAYRRDGYAPLALAGIALRAHWSLLSHAGVLLRKRRAIRKGALVSPAQYAKLLRRHAISAREIARL